MCIGQCLENICNENGVCYECIRGYYGTYCNLTCTNTCGTSGYCDRENGDCTDFVWTTTSVILCILAILFVCTSVVLCLYVQTLLKRYPRYPLERNMVVNQGYEPL